MGYLQYLKEIRRDKQSSVMRYLLRVRCWEYRQNTAIHRASGPTYLDKARMLGYRNIPGMCIFRARVRRGARPKKVLKGNTHGKPSKSGVYQRKPAKRLQAFAEIRVGRKCSNMRVFNSYWVGQDRVYKYFEVIMVDPYCDRIKNDKKINWLCKPVMKHREARGLTNGTKTSRGLGKGIRYNQTKGGSKRAAWRNRNTQSLRRYR
ncbi:Ribosomal protein L15 [Spraguea lophii 42_110]|uniref:Ribosomal protein L15 n=1 Tax=Spraguea lophii (strain 42_110) TaxID=1358809 RepID=S7W7A2_SPRLO|nr:Chain LN0, Ribosomal protein L15 [Spraguea lophii 42_110]7QJH_KN0 Chain KN0, Ribosomal protein L15 [Spraguea lophii 42_110]7QJH_LN0 Chain LN0, Ribosomal protein L15 [Spraguea lophii 42_110]8BR3_LN0 Chain LN0, Ribosomal protein L15 [Spraguea lophii 42_110]8P5D_LN0 Chain LN0, Ribosomal protein L15 [Spraguea lophii 42_110]8P60_KN0 Chain KN0, Ribosomal protein L15 [Spraguea lophii 42_110]8P60_LN0 Chain LN0, Ribosomal protein L15 [Spraguea lophii 42_110]EPR78681.1 Ribosomal protein L15 [Spragu